MIRARHGSLRRAGALFLLLSGSLALPACGDDAAPEVSHVGQGRGPGGGRPLTGATAQDVPMPGVAGQLPTPRDRRAERRVAAALPPEPSGGGAMPAGGSDDRDDGREEDPLPAALQRAFGTPTDCVSEETRGRLHETLSIHVSVRVGPSGRPVSADVTGAQLSDADLACMRARALSLRLPGPVEGAPRTVTANMNYQVADSRTQTETREAFLSFGLPEPAPGGPPRTGTVNAPGATLPAGGTVTERPTGFVAPSSTLPAVVP